MKPVYSFENQPPVEIENNLLHGEVSPKSIINNKLEYLEDNTDEVVIPTKAEEIYGFIEVRLYDDSSLNPIEGAEVYLYNASWDFHMEGITDVNGFCNFTGLSVGEYDAIVDTRGFYYQSQYCYIDYLGEKETLDFYLFRLPLQNVRIISPSYSATIQGGQVLIEYEPLYDTDRINFLEIIVNDEFVYRDYMYFPGTNEVVVPVFSNGTKFIELIVEWYDNSYGMDYISVNSIDVIPISDLKEGDYLNYRINEYYTYENIDYHYIYDFNFTFNTWISPFEISTSLVYHHYSDSMEFELSEYWLIINVLNGFISDGNMWWLNYHFSFLSGLSCMEVTGSLPTIGEKVPYFNWDHIYTVNAFDTWNGLDVAILNRGDEIIYIDVNYGTFVYYERYYNDENNNIRIHYVTDTNIGPIIDSTSPSIDSSSTLNFEIGSLGNNINWTAYDNNPYNYTIYKDGVFLENGTWESGFMITTTLDGTSVSTHVYLLEVMDSFGNSASKIIIVNIEDTIPPAIDSPDDKLYEEGMTGNQIIWHPIDLTSNIFIVYRDGVFLRDGLWTVGEPIVVPIDGFSIGKHNLTIIVYDAGGNSVTDTVFVTVIVLVSEYRIYHSLLILLVMPLAQLIILIRKRRK